MFEDPILIPGTVGKTERGLNSSKDYSVTLEGKDTSTTNLVITVVCSKIYLWGGRAKSGEIKTFLQRKDKANILHRSYRDL